jgi:hypothetical protein
MKKRTRRDMRASTASTRPPVTQCGRMPEPYQARPAQSLVLNGARCSVIELPGGVNDNPCHEEVDYSYFSALCSGNGADFLRERLRHNDDRRDYATTTRASALR